MSRNAGLDSVIVDFETCGGGGVSDCREDLFMTVSDGEVLWEDNFRSTLYNIDRGERTIAYSFD